MSQCEAGAKVPEGQVHGVSVGHIFHDSFQRVCIQGVLLVGQAVQRGDGVRWGAGVIDGAVPRPGVIGCKGGLGGVPRPAHVQRGLAYPLAIGQAEGGIFNLFSFCRSLLVQCEDGRYVYHISVSKGGLVRHGTGAGFVLRPCGGEAYGETLLLAGGRSGVEVFAATCCHEQEDAEEYPCGQSVVHTATFLGVNEWFSLK